MAFGADRTRVVVMVMRGAFVQFILGLMVGIPIALMGARMMENQLYLVNRTTHGAWRLLFWLSRERLLWQASFPRAARRLLIPCGRCVMSEGRDGGVSDGCPMFAPAYMGPKKTGAAPSNASTMRTKRRRLREESCDTWSESIRKNRFRPMYAGANMGHPSSLVWKRNSLGSSRRIGPGSFLVCRFRRGRVALPRLLHAFDSRPCGPACSSRLSPPRRQSGCAIGRR